MAHADQALGPPLRIGVSACLLGQDVRWNGGHKRDSYLLGTLDPYVQWIPVCPEVEIGLGTPRETIRLVDEGGDIFLRGTKSGSDHTDEMNSWSRDRVQHLAGMNLHGFILKKDSPTCGLFRVKVYRENSMPERVGRGLFAEQLVKQLPILPMEEEGRLRDPGLRENFIRRLFTYQRWTELLATDPSPAGLIRFHTAHKLTLLANSPDHYKRLGQLVAQAGKLPGGELSIAYGQLLMEGLSKPSSRGKHVNVLQHLLGFVKDELDDGDKHELLGVIEDYRQGMVPLIVPLTLMRHHLRRADTPDWVHQQVYLNPYPKELALLSHV